MPLKISLKPHETVIIGNALIKNGDTKSTLLIENETPVLREKDILIQENISTPCQKVYYILQKMYLGRNPKEYHEEYFDAIKDLIDAAPHTFLETLADIGNYILGGKYYYALKTAKTLIEKETALLETEKTKHP